jgi:hypothetical protein
VDVGRPPDGPFWRYPSFGTTGTLPPRFDGDEPDLPSGRCASPPQGSALAAGSGQDDLGADPGAGEDLLDMLVEEPDAAVRRLPADLRMSLVPWMR